MKRIVIVFISFLIVISNIDATPGRIVSSSVTTCNNVTYGYHSKDKHWHVVVRNDDGTYNATGDELGLESPCKTNTVQPKTIEPQIPISNKQIVRLSSCVDGDTAKFITNKGIESTRFLAIDTPEYTTQKEPFGLEASQFTCNKLKDATKIELEFDKESDLYDKYKRLLAWIWVDGYLLQDEIIKAGLAEVAYLYGDYKYTPLLQDHQEVAKAQGLNIWSSGINLTPVTSIKEEEKVIIPENNNNLIVPKTPIETNENTSEDDSSLKSEDNDTSNESQLPALTETAEKEITSTITTSLNQNNDVLKKNTEESNTSGVFVLFGLTFITYLFYSRYSSSMALIRIGTNDFFKKSKIRKAIFYFIYTILILPVFYDLTLAGCMTITKVFKSIKRK
ncbi:MAG: thermonuclease family protein [Bacilli bacterium]|nr:thermonuclease family protein [Bacilli bacterium]MDD4547685.1 thermonuclease family protein [Bacilli bacterium]